MQSGDDYVTVFFYGLFMDPNALEGLGFQPSNVRRAFIEGFALQVGKRATVVPCHGARTYGTVVTLSRVDLDALYSEASVAEYRPIPVTANVISSGQEFVVCYSLPNADGGASVDRVYLARLQAAARKVGLPEEYISQIAAMV